MAGSRGRWGSAWVGGGVALASLVLYAVLAQSAFWGMDVHTLISFVAHDRFDHSYHFLYLRLAALVDGALQPLGFTTHESLTAASALGTAVAVFCFHRAAARLGLAGWRVVAVPVLAAVCPGIVFFATVAEIHGLFMAFAGVCWLAFARLVHAPSIATGIALGAATGLAATVHATGHLLLPFAFAAFALPALAARGPNLARVLAPGVGAAVVHAAVVWTGAKLLQPPHVAGLLGGQRGFFEASLARIDALEPVLGTVWNEWLWPFLPISFVALLGVFRVGVRAMTWAVLVSLSVYLAVAFVMLFDTTERGAYLLPFAFPAAVLAVRLLPPPGAWLCALLALGTAVRDVVEHDRPVGIEAMTAGLRDLAGDLDIFLLCAGYEEINPILRRVPEVQSVSLYTLVAEVERQPEGQSYEAFCAWFDALHADLTRRGKTLIFTAEAFRGMATGWEQVRRQRILRRLTTEHLRDHYLFGEIRRGAFHGLWIAAKPN